MAGGGTDEHGQLSMHLEAADAFILDRFCVEVVEVGVVDRSEINRPSLPAVLVRASPLVPTGGWSTAWELHRDRKVRTAMTWAKDHVRPLDPNRLAWNDHDPPGRHVSVNR
jgi:hypothetical protein